MARRFNALQYNQTCEICGEVGDEVGVVEGENRVFKRVCGLCDIDGSNYNGWGHYQQKCSQCEITDDVFECSICEVQYCFECEPGGEKVYDNYCRFCYACNPGYEDESISDPSESEGEDCVSLITLEEVLAIHRKQMDTSEGEIYNQRVEAGIGA
jgi:hypothetical protein